MNLCINARDAMQGNGRLRISVQEVMLQRSTCDACQQSFSGRHLALSVTDTGPGIAEGIRSRMFEPFYSTKEVGKGSGMGLAMVHGIVHESGGHICVESTAQGASFTILLPPVINADALADTADEPSENRSSNLLIGKVLLVDDEALVAEFMLEQLEAWGLDVTAFRDPEHALDMIRSNTHSWDLAILDQSMPKLTGFALAQQLLQHSPDTRVILYTGYSDTLDTSAVLRSGIKALLRKPIDQAQLHTLIQEYLHKPA